MSAALAPEPAPFFSKRIGFSILVYFVVTMATAYPWHMLLFHEKYVAMGAFTRGHPIMPFGMAAILLQGWVFAYFYPLFLKQRPGHWAIRGVQYSLFLGLTVWTVMVFATAAKFKIEPVAHFVGLGTTFQLIQFTCVGAALGFLHRDLAENQ